MNADQIISELKNKVYHPVYFLMGEESYYIDAVSDYIEEHVLDENEKEFNQTIVYGRETDVQTLLSHVKRFPMMSNYQVVIVKEAQTMNSLIPQTKEKEKSKKNEKKIANDKHPFEQYLESPLKSTILVICYKYKTLDKRKTIYKTLEKAGIVLESAKIQDYKIPEWIESYVKKKDYSIQPKATMLLAESLGSDLSKIANEIDKLTINVSKGTPISPEAVETYIGISKDFNVFELQKAIGRKDIYKANQIINYFSSNTKENPMVMTISILYSFFSKLLLYHSTGDKSRNNIASVLSVNPYFINDYADSAKNYTLPKLYNIISYLREFDVKSKGIDNAGVPEGELMKELLFKILH